jgi:lipopolysaccharide biosynthesis protein
MMTRLRSIAFHLPQFHPFEENNQWWGKGFTEWTNVTKAKPHFKNHYQPHLPSDLGFYDLRLAETRMAQEAMAKEYGIYGFCYYHYWFSGKKLMHEPLDRKLKNPQEDLPFMLCWANENWSRRWDGMESDLLIEQSYSEADDVAHMKYLCEHFFSDKRYIRVDNKPVFVVYRPQLFPDIAQTLQSWRAVAKDYGFELYLAYTTSFNTIYDLNKTGFDAAIEFAPHFYPPKRYFHTSYNKLINRAEHYRNRLLHKLKLKNHQVFDKKVSTFINKYVLDFFNKNIVADYNELVEFRKKQEIAPNTYPSLFPMWDNTARKKGNNGVVYVNNTPEKYSEWLMNICKKFKPFSKEENFVFINAWNEWAEGNHLEPCHRWGNRYLKATKEALQLFNH